ncbi:hypothetical protein MARA_32670 [Mycolicibacterium arabiense]|uniref:Uncharacterized protein n=1 Tax=Mycolicibacterium arabiense TaxID=1286181 RepID=A0A7I7S0S3_9MYCO|nr:MULTISPECIES: hypothetical protein [Mycobacteriaceae]MCV7371109.1 hypothetical protein [Mycolicibacterium arabiense]BBY49799.1 hypothetical protein MARA_32670 [Mycolicibacterium arabiense]
MSKSSAAKKARRKKRVSTRNSRWMPAEVHADLEAVTELDALLIDRGWEFDEEFSNAEVVSWFYPPSAAEIDDESREPVTRMWLTNSEEQHVLLVGTGPDDHDYVFTHDELVESLDELEAYRAGDPLPASG